MGKKEKKQKIRFEDEEVDPPSGWGPSSPNDGAWGMPTAQPGWGQTDETNWGRAEAGWTNSPTGGGARADTNNGGSHWTSWGHPPAVQNRTKAQVPFGQQQYNKPQVGQAIPTLKFQQPAENMYQQPAQWGSTWDAGIPEEDEDGLSYADEEEYGYPEAQTQPQVEYFPSPASYHASSPSKTIHDALGSPGAGRTFGPPPPNPHTHRFFESQGAALSRAHKALYAQERMAKDRIHWSFSPEKDERVRTLLEWIQGMSEGIGALGLQKFLQSGERGALFVNAEFRPHQSPHEPAFDWLPLEQLKDTMDKILQESVALYDPATQVIVFVFLLSKSANSMAVWRRKITVVESFHAMYPEEIEDAIANLPDDVVVYVDEMPTTPGGKPTKKRHILSKRKWWKPWKSKTASVK